MSTPETFDLTKTDIPPKPMLPNDEGFVQPDTNNIALNGDYEAVVQDDGVDVYLMPESSQVYQMDMQTRNDSLVVMSEADFIRQRDEIRKGPIPPADIEVYRGRVDAVDEEIGDALNVLKISLRETAKDRDLTIESHLANIEAHRGIMDARLLLTKLGREAVIAAVNEHFDTVAKQAEDIFKLNEKIDKRIIKLTRRNWNRALKLATGMQVHFEEQIADLSDLTDRCDKAIKDAESLSGMSPEMQAQIDAVNSDLETAKATLIALRGSQATLATQRRDEIESPIAVERNKLSQTEEFQDKRRELAEQHKEEFKKLSAQGNTQAQNDLLDKLEQEVLDNMSSPIMVLLLQKLTSNLQQEADNQELMTECMKSITANTNRLNVLTANFRNHLQNIAKQHISFEGENETVNNTGMKKFENEARKANVVTGQFGFASATAGKTIKPEVRAEASFGNSLITLSQGVASLRTLIETRVLPDANDDEEDVDENWEGYNPDALQFTDVFEQKVELPTREAIAEIYTHETTKADEPTKKATPEEGKTSFLQKMNQKVKNWWSGEEAEQEQQQSNQRALEQ